MSDALAVAEMYRLTDQIAARFRRLLESRAEALAKGDGRDDVTAVDVLDALEEMETCEIDVDDLIEIDID